MLLLSILRTSFVSFHSDCVYNPKSHGFPSISLIRAIEAFRAAIATVLVCSADWAKLFLPASLGNPLECHAGLLAMVEITRLLSARCWNRSCCLAVVLECRCWRLDRSFHLTSSSFSRATMVCGRDGENSSSLLSSSRLEVAELGFAEALYKRVWALAYSSTRAYCWSKSSKYELGSIVLVSLFLSVQAIIDGQRNVQSNGCVVMTCDVKQRDRSCCFDG